LRCNLKPTILLVWLASLAACTTGEHGDLYDAAVYDSHRSIADRWDDNRRQPAEIIRFAGVQPGMRVADLFAGGGYYSEILSRAVGDAGQVYLQNNSLFLRSSGDQLSERLKRNRLSNVTRVDSEFAALDLPSGLDQVFMVLSYHDIHVPREDPAIMTNPAVFFPQLKAALKPGGRVLIVDHAAMPGSGTSTTAELHRIDEASVEEDFRRAGFELVGKFEGLRNKTDNYEVDVWDDEVRGHTDRFVHLYELVDRR